MLNIEEGGREPVVGWQRERKRENECTGMESK